MHGHLAPSQQEMNGLIPQIKPIPLDNQGSFSQIQLIIGYKDFIGLLVSEPTMRLSGSLFLI